jgi:molybdate transport system substrate-binding protein
VAGQELIVSAAASLTNAFKEIGAAFEKNHSDLKVILNFAASGPLLQQLERGAPVDVFASADQETMNRGQGKGLISATSRRDFTANRLVLVASSLSPVVIKSLDDLTNPAVKRIAVGKPETVPAGRYAQQALEMQKLGELLRPKFIYADSVRQVLDYVSRGEVEAGFVYLTDAVIAKDKVKLVAELATEEPITYPIAIVTASKQPQLAADFVNFVLSPGGQAILANYGFRKP